MVSKFCCTLESPVSSAQVSLCTPSPNVWGWGISSFKRPPGGWDGHHLSEPLSGSCGAGCEINSSEHSLGCTTVGSWVPGASFNPCQSSRRWVGGPPSQVSELSHRDLGRTGAVCLAQSWQSGCQLRLLPTSPGPGLPGLPVWASRVHIVTVQGRQEPWARESQMCSRYI